MSEYKRGKAYHWLAGASWLKLVGEEGDQLTDVVRRRPYSVILLDEIKKRILMFSTLAAADYGRRSLD